MKLLFVEYLASLRERGELDAIMPDLLSEIGWSVISRPAVGTTQHGVDVAAVGPDEDGVRRLHLISIKSGNLTRSGWDSGKNSVRPSLNQIQDVYIPRRIPKRHRNLPVCVVLCIGGELHEDVQAEVNGYIETRDSAQISFCVWNGDRLAELLLSGVLRENALPTTWRSDFRKALALVDEPDASSSYFRSFVTSIADECSATRSRRLTAVRQIYVGLWTLFVWGREAKNSESGYQCSEYATLVGWSLIKDYIGGTSKWERQLWESMGRLVELHVLIADDYISRYIEPRANSLHALSAAVPSHISLDVNLRLFDIVGRVGLRGIWRLWAAGLDSTGKGRELVQEDIRQTAQLVIDIVQNNPILLTPIKDEQAIDVNIACLFLSWVGCREFVKGWLGQIARATEYAFRTNGPYPCIFRDYHDLADHPKGDPEYRAMATGGSILVPTLALWAAVTEDTETLAVLAEFTSGPYAHSTLQLWYPGDDSEDHMYRGSSDHGLAATNIEISRSCRDMLSPIRAECEASSAFRSLSAIRWRLWPLVILASRHHRVPVPPHFWPLTDEESGP